MGEILGLGVTHYPPLTGVDKAMAGILRGILKDPGLPERYRDPANWPEQLRREFSDDNGEAAATAHRAALVQYFRHARAVLDEFKPDVIVVWGDDQYENFTEDIVPPFCILAYDEISVQPWLHTPWYNDGPSNVWGEGRDTSFRIQGHRKAAKYLAGGLLEQGIDMAYAYRPLHKEGLGHAFVNTQLFLDYDRTGFPYPLVAFQVNCYGRRVIAQKGGRASLASPIPEDDLDPPSPSPRRCMEVGAATARVLRDSPYRAALIASSSWSHAFLTDKHYQLYPDVDADRRLYEALRRGDYETWRNTSLADIESSGQQEMLNWFCLAGAMEELGRTPEQCDFVETWALNSNKCFAAFNAPGAPALSAPSNATVAR
jgi:hypothetical protein